MRTDHFADAYGLDDAVAEDDAARVPVPFEYTHPEIVWTYVMSATQRRFGAAAWKHRSSRSDGRSAGSPGTVVGGLFRFGLAPCHRNSLTVQFQPYFPRPVHLPPFLSCPHLHDLLLQDCVTDFRAVGSASRFVAW